MTADDLFNNLSLKFPPREYAVLSQVRNCTGFSGQIRTADALIMSLWPSRGLELAGVEIKIDRRDWIREKDDPEKADAIGKYCDRWWIVTPPDIVKPDEVPSAWGHMIWVEEKTKWTVVKPAELLQAKPITKDFLAALLRKASESSVPLASIDDQVKEAVEQKTKMLTANLKKAQEDVRMFKQRILDFESASGVSIGINDWTYPEPKELGLAVRQVMNGDHKKIEHRLRALKDAAGTIMNDLDRSLRKLEP